MECALTLSYYSNSKCKGKCAFHIWLKNKNILNVIETNKDIIDKCKTLKLPESSRFSYLLSIDPTRFTNLLSNKNKNKNNDTDEDEDKNPTKHVKKYRCIIDDWHRYKKASRFKKLSSASSASSASSTSSTSSASSASSIHLSIASNHYISVNPGVMRLIKFTKMIDFFGMAPWANMLFSINESMIKRLIASHLSLIVGVNYWKNEKAALYTIIDAVEAMSNIQNVVWVTNRQQGKTSTLAKFLATLSLLSPIGGNLVCVYSTSLDRAQELCRAAKKYIYWAMHDEKCKSFFKSLEFTPPNLVQDNERAYAVRSQYEGVVNTVIARPKNPDSCRGDAPKAAFFDEIGFVSADFWYKFAYPLLQVGKRVFTCATTPPASSSFFSVFIDNVIKRNEASDFFFLLINHSLVCAKCHEAGCAVKCVHKLGLVPPWKSLLRFTQMKQLVPAKRMGDYQAEVYGVLQPDGSRYFPAQLVDTCIQKRKPIEQNTLPKDNTIIYKHPKRYLLELER